MAKREVFKDIELGGRKWRIGSFDALTGSYIATLLLMQVLPMGLQSQLGISFPESSSRSLMDKTTFINLQKDCLKVVSEIDENTKAYIPIMLPDDRWAIRNLENDVSTVLALTLHVLLFNITDFFQGDTLNDLTKSFQGLKLFSVNE